MNSLKTTKKGYTLAEMAIALTVSLILISTIATLLYLVVKESGRFDAKHLQDEEYAAIKATADDFFEHLYYQEENKLSVEVSLDKKKVTITDLTTTPKITTTYEYRTVDNLKALYLNNTFITDFNQVSDITFEKVSLRTVSGDTITYTGEIVIKITVTFSDGTFLNLLYGGYDK